MYAWVWRHLPFGLAGKITGSLLLTGGAAALLWFVAFPWIDPWVEEMLLPWDQGQLTGDWQPGADTVDPDNPVDSDGEVDPNLIGPDGEFLGDYDIPYDLGD